jgi:hypothetical protein
MAVNLSPYGGVGAQFLDNAGNVLTGGKIYTYAAGTTTPQVAYTNTTGAIPHSNPIILNAAGRVPGGEIWLTDGLLYKFVLRDSNDVLIATYDNIAGINSNFVAFTNQQEIQTATAGQTVFNLTTMTYQPGTNSLSVFVDGVNQYGPGSSYAYLETDSDTVTFVTGLHVGAEVKFTTSNLNSSASVNDAEQVSYIPPFTGSVATNVEAKLAQLVSVKDFGATGDGVTDDTVAIQNAATETNPAGVLFFPSGVYKVASNLTINTNALFDNAKVTVNTSVTFTINGTVTAGLNEIFTGAGTAVVTEKTPVIYPEWWGAAQNDFTIDSEPAITKAITCSSNNRNTVYFSGNYGIATVVTIPATAQINSSRRSTIRPSTGSGLTNGIIMAAGNALGRFQIPTFAGFSGVALQVRCNLANIYVPQFNACGICIQFNSGHSGVAASILDTVVEFDAISACTTAVNFNHNFALDIIQGCGAKGNFITNTLNAVIFSGVSVNGRNDGLFLDVLAIDFVNGTGTFLDNQTSFNISRFTANVRSWFGGDGFSAGTPTQFVKGPWNACVVDIVNARGFNQTNFTPDLIKASIIKFRGSPSRASAIGMVPLSSGLAGFNGGNMMHNSYAVMKVVLASDVVAGDTASYYFWHVAGDGDYYPWKMVRVDGGGGLIVESIHDQSSVEDGRVAVSLRNIGSSTVTTGTTAYFYLERAA